MVGAMWARTMVPRRWRTCLLKTESSDGNKYDVTDHFLGWQVETLKMGWCHVGPDNGAKAVADLLMFNNTLAVLDLRGNGLGNAGAVHLARALKEHSNDKLTELDLGYNEIKDEGACTLAQVPLTLHSPNVTLCSAVRPRWRRDRAHCTPLGCMHRKRNKKGCM